MREFSICTKDESAVNSDETAPGLHVIPYVYFMCVCCSYTPLSQRWFRGATSTSCGEVCLDNICAVVPTEKGRTEQHSQRCENLVINQRMLRNEAWIYLCCYQLLYLGAQIEFHFKRPQSTHLCVSVPSQASQHCSSHIMALAFPALSSPHLIYFKKQHFINYSHLLVSCVRARVHVEVLCACDRVVD